MPGVKNVNIDTNEIIGRNDKKAAPTLNTQSAKLAKEDAAKKPILIRFNTQLLERVDAAAKRRGLSRSAWIQFTVSLALDHD